MPKTIHSDEYKKLIIKLKSAREEVGLTQVEAGKKMGKDQTFISKVESGQYRLDALQLSKFATLYKKKLSYFLKS